MVRSATVAVLEWPEDWPAMARAIVKAVTRHTHPSFSTTTFRSPHKSRIDWKLLLGTGRNQGWDRRFRTGLLRKL